GQTARVWIIRAGRAGGYEQRALEGDVAVLGWSDIGRVSPNATRDDLKALIREQFGEEREASLSAQAGQIFRFIHEVQEGDLVVLPLLANPGNVAVGRIVGPYQFRSDGPFQDADAKQTRPVDWVTASVPYARFPE